MCGITGFARSGVKQLHADDAEVLARMTATLARRGPDAGGHRLSGPVALGHRRLSIIDIAGGIQPMVDTESGLAVVLNGEIYNFRELNTELAGHGVMARTRSDTESLLNSYKVWGPKCLEKFNGMFGFVVQDPRNRCLFGARDRTGKKPFYYYHRRGLFAFGSELKSLLQHPDIRAVIDPEAAARYFMHEFVPSPYSIFKGIKRLAGGECLTYHWDTDELKVETYWDFYKVRRPEPADASEAHWEKRILEELEAAVRRRLVADVPVGAFLSGGIDSSSVTAMMAKIMGAKNVKTFSIGFNDKRFDESQHARRMANHLGTEHHEELLSANTAMEILPDVLSFLDEPFADPSILPTFLLARFARGFVKVALAGDGGDELLAGYDTFKALSYARAYNAVVPSFAHHHIVKPLTRLLPVSYGNFSFDFRVRQMLRGLKSTEQQRLWRWLGSFVPEELNGLLEPAAFAGVNMNGLYDGVEKLYDNVADRDATDRDGYIFAKTYLADGVLTKVDRATMACSLEARSPLLDHDFVRLLCEIPSRLKYRGGLSKYIMRRALRGMLPEDILKRPKKGFGMPVGDWFRGKFRSMLLDTLHERRIRDAGILRPEKVNRLVQDHLSGKSDNRKPLWTLFMFEQWRERWLKQETPSRVERVPQLAAK